MGSAEWWQVTAVLVTGVVAVLSFAVKLIRNACDDQLAAKDARIAQLEEASRLFSASEVRGQFDSMRGLIESLQEEVELLTEEVERRFSMEDIEDLRPQIAEAIREVFAESDNRNRIIMLAMQEQLERYREETGRDWALRIPHDAFRRSAEVRDEIERRNYVDE